MSVEVINKVVVRQKIAERGWTLKWVIAQLGLGQEGYAILRGERLPKDPDDKARIVKDLAKLLGVTVPQILLRLEAREAS